jgi:eukaryotic-like serine/threonine-protein kinase
VTPERWERVKSVFQSTLERAPAQRHAFLGEACAGDLALQGEVESLVAWHDRAGTFIQEPLLPPSARLVSGSHLGPYEIVRLLGSGGMGDVYLGRDPRLEREVALKVLTSDMAADQEWRERLLREARAVSALNHPNICTIYEIGSAEGQYYVCFEHIQGQRLDALLGDGGLSLEGLLDLALPLAEALAHAHGKGILHGDLKPANIMVSDLGSPKVVDFGLAKVRPVAERPAREPAAGLTEAGLVVGTAAYMSPEQALGRATDERSDIFSFGVVLYEMATGRAAFAGATPIDLLDAVLHADPDPVARIRPDLPAELSLVAEKALNKDPSERYQHMSDLAADLRRLRRPASAIKTSALVAGAAAAVTLLVVLAVWFVPRFRKEASVPATSHIIQVTTLPGLEYSPTWSPDGRSIAYVSDAAGNLDIYVQQTGSGQAIRVTDSAADDVQPAWSPDGSRIAFVSARAYADKRLSVLIGMSRLQSVLALRYGDVWVMPALGGTARRIAQDAYDPAWSPDGKKIIYAAPREGVWALWIREVDAPSEPRKLAVGVVRPAPPVFESALPMIQPAWSPDGKWIAFTAGRDPFLRVFVVPSEGGQASVLTEADANTQMPSWSPDGRWLYFSSERSGRVNLYKARFQDGRLGPTRQVTAGSGADLQARLDPQGRRIAYSSVRDVSDLWEYDLKSEQAIRLTSETTHEDNASPSSDGTWLAFTSNRLNGNHLWLLNRRTGGLAQVSTVPSSALQTSSRWSWDGRYVLYSRSPDERGSIIWQYEVSTGASRKIFRMHEGDGDFCVSADDKHLILAHQSGGFVRVELASGRREVLERLAAAVRSDLACSPDGQWVAFHVQRDDDRDIWLIPLAGGTPRQLTSGDNEDSHPAWSADSRFIYFVRNHQDIYAVPRSGGEAKPVTHYRSFSVTLDYPAVSSDGKKILFTRIDKTGDIYLLDDPPG